MSSTFVAFLAAHHFVNDFNHHIIVIAAHSHSHLLTAIGARSLPATS